MQKWTRDGLGFVLGGNFRLQTSADVHGPLPAVALRPWRAMASPQGDRTRCTAMDRTWELPGAAFRRWQRFAAVLRRR